MRLISNHEHANLPQALRTVNPSGSDEALAGLGMLLRSRRATDVEWSVRGRRCAP